LVPSLIQLIQNTRAVTVPVASVAVGLKPVPKVSVKLVVPDVRTIRTHDVPAGGTVVVSVAVAVGVTLTESRGVPKARAVVPFATVAWVGV
jgi:hypothetical protein